MTAESTDPRPDEHAAEPLALRLNNQLGLAEDARLLAMARAAMPTLGLELDDDADVAAVRAGLLRMMRAAVAAERERNTRKPLTHMQIVMLWGHRSDGPSTPEIVSFARLLERHHGIGA